VTGESSPQQATHDWSADPDLGHLAEIRRRSGFYAPDGVLHLVHEVLAYVNDESEFSGRSACEVRLFTDGSVSVTDQGRGTDTHRRAEKTVRKPIMSTRDLRFFDAADPPLLPDGTARRGMSVVAALSTWLVHTNRRPEGAWVQRYERGLPVSDLVSVPVNGKTGTSVNFLAGFDLTPLGGDVASRLEAAWPELSLTLIDGRFPRA
jgi:topoisomerase IV subunit B